MKLAAIALLLTTALAAPLAAQTPEQVAAAALKAAPIWDGHNDVPIQLRGRYGNVLADFDFHDTTHAKAYGEGEATPMHTDLPRLREGKVGAQFWSVYVSSALTEPQAVQTTIEQIDLTKRLIAAYPDDLALALSSADVEKALKAGKIASLIGMEGGHSIGSSLGVLRQMYDLGARYLTLTHSKNTPWADSADDVPAHGGLSDFGKDVVREMQRIGMLVDLSHVNIDTMMDALDVARAPVIFSHSNALALNGDSRNVPDNVLQRLKANGGIIMITGVPNFLNEAQRQWIAAEAAEKARLGSLFQGQPDRVAADLASWTAAHPMPPASTTDMADHIDHVRQVIGVDHIGIGGDYDGIPAGPVGMEDVRSYPVLFTELARRGYSQSDLEKISNRNMMRVLKAAESYSAAHRTDPVIESAVSG